MIIITVPKTSLTSTEANSHESAGKLNKEFMKYVSNTASNKSLLTANNWEGGKEKE